MEVRRQKDGRVILVHFPTQEEAVDHVRAKFPGWQIRNVVEITQKAHFHIADGDPK